MRLRLPVRALASVLLWGSVSHAAPPATDAERPDPGHEETLSDTGSGLEATSPRSGCTAPSSACALVFLDHEADAFIFLDGSDLLAAGPVELILDWDLFDDLESPVGFHDMRASTSPCRMALTRLRRKSLHPQRRGLWRPRCSDARGLFRWLRPPASVNVPWAAS
jgi:hypothetical protein